MLTEMEIRSLEISNHSGKILFSPYANSSDLKVLQSYHYLKERLNIKFLLNNTAFQAP